MKKTLEFYLFSVRWMLIPFYLLLGCAMLLYLINSCMWFFTHLGFHSSENDAMLFVVEMMDIAMIANLGKMVITGSYNSFVDKEHGYKNDNVSSGLLKVKMATSLIGITSIHLLKSFVAVHKVEWDDLYKLLVIHGAFLLGALVLAYVDYLHERTETLNEKQKEEKHKD